MFAQQFGFDIPTLITFLLIAGFICAAFGGNSGDPR